MAHSLELREHIPEEVSEGLVSVHILMLGGLLVRTLLFVEDSFCSLCCILYGKMQYHALGQAAHLI